MFTVLVLSASIGAEPAFVVENKTTQRFTVVNRTKQTPVQPAADRFTATDGITYERGADGVYRQVAALPAARTTSGCGCTASANCGAPFCKSKGGTGCPVSCPVKVASVTESAPQTYSLPQSSGGCVGGNCPAQSSRPALFPRLRGR
jgi:hypothetical protein